MKRQPWVRAFLHEYCKPYWLSGFKFYRSWWGGHWEKWCTDAGGSCWLDTDYCSKTHGIRYPGCFGTPTCEEHR